MTERQIWLDSDSLMSKWGFDDGDTPEDFADWATDEQGLDYRDVIHHWHPTLISLVRRHLLPILDQDVVVYEIGGIHNPIRAETVDGQEVDDYDVRNETNPTITPDGVGVTFWDALEELRRQIAQAADHAISS